MGHFSMRAARIYPHTTEAREKIIADALGKIAEDALKEDEEHDREAPCVVHQTEPEKIGR